MLKPKAKEQAIDLVPDGSYTAELTKINQFKNSYGDRIGFEFTLRDKSVNGIKVMRSTSTQLSEVGKLADVLRGVLGRELSSDELSKGIDIESLIGTECQVLVLKAKSKNSVTYNNVERVFPIEKKLNLIK